MKRAKQLLYASMTVLIFGVAALPASAQTPGTAAGPKAVLSQTIRGITVTLSDKRWSTKDSFRFSYTVEADPPLSLPPEKSLLDFVTGVVVTAPDGSLADAHADVFRTERGAARTMALISTRDVDPRWPVIGVDIDVLDPAAPPRASGRFVGPITISNIPVPAESNTVSHVHAETVTPLGTHVVAEKVQVSPGAAATKTTFVFRVIPDPEASDLRFSDTTALVADDTGAILGQSGSWSNFDMLEHQTEPRLSSTAVFGVPAPGAKTLRLTLNVAESSEQMRDDSYYLHFHLLLPLKALYTEPVRASPPPLTKQGKDLVAQMDSLDWRLNRYHLRLILRDRRDPDVHWHMKSVQATDDAGSTLVTGARMGLVHYDDKFFWKADGAPLAPEEAAQETDLGGVPTSTNPYEPTPPVPAKTLTLTVQAEALRPQQHILDFTALPLPADGQTLTVSKTVSDAFGGKLTLEKITAYSPAHPLPPGVADRIFPLSVASSGLALLMAEPPSKTATVFDYQLFAANEAAGRHLRPVSTAFHGAGDALSDAPPAPGAPRMVTLFLRLPALGAKTFNLRMGRTEQIDLHKSETLVFPNVPVPPKPPAL